MSALLQARVFAAPGKLSEFEATRQIGRLAIGGIEPEISLDRIAQTALSIQGVVGIRIEPGPELSAYLGTDLVWGRAAVDSASMSAVAEIKAGSWSWGQSRVYFDVRDCPLESPLAFARFVAQQLACLFNRIALLGQRDLLLRRRARIEERLTTRKVVERAKGILAERHLLSQIEALRLLVSLARHSRRSLRRVAQSIIFARQ